MNSLSFLVFAECIKDTINPFLIQNILLYKYYVVEIVWISLQECLIWFTHQA